MKPPVLSAQRSLPVALTSSVEFSALSPELQEGFRGHVSFMLEVPVKLQDWLDSGASRERLRALVMGLDLDISIHIGTPPPEEMEISAHAIRELWADDSVPLVELISPSHVFALNLVTPQVGASHPEIEEWIRSAANALSRLFEGFFSASKFNSAVAYLSAIHVSMAGIKYGLGRVDMKYPK